MAFTLAHRVGSPAETDVLATAGALAAIPGVEAFESWYETGPDPVYAAASETEDSAFVRVLVLPVEWEGKRTIAYVDPADEENPKLQRARIYLEERL